MMRVIRPVRSDQVFPVREQKLYFTLFYFSCLLSIFIVAFIFLFFSFFLNLCLQLKVFELRTQDFHLGLDLILRV